MKQRTLTGVVLALLSMVLLGCFHLPRVPQLIAILLGCGAVCFWPSSSLCSP